MSSTIGFRPTPEDERILREAAHPGESTSDTTRMLVDQIRSIDTDYVVGDPVDYLSHEQMAEVELALARYLGIHGVTNTRAR